MSQVYVVTEGTGDVNILKRILPGQLVKQTVFVSGGGTYSAQSLAATLLGVRQRPVALVVDANTENLTLVNEQRSFLRELLQQASSGTEFAIFTAVPELEAILFQNKSLFEQVIQRELSEAEWQAARHNPSQFFETLTSVEAVLANLSDENVRNLQYDPLIQELTEFLSKNANGQNGM